jgi:dTDP-4-dehydrorhamnose 3,5-epimerase
LIHITSTPLAGAAVVNQERHADARGFFARTFCEDEFADAGLPIAFPQHSVSFNAHRGTLRGLHFQLLPYEEPKLVRCTGGAIFDVIVDLRPDSPSFARWWGIELTAVNGTALYIPPGFAHGFQCLSDNTELLYLIGTRFVPAAATGVRWDDVDLAIKWPLPISVMSDRDRHLPTLAEFLDSNRPGPMKAST